MTNGRVDTFMRDGFVHLEGAVPRAVAAACAAELWAACGLDPADRSTWTEPVVWVGGMTQPSFVAAMNADTVLDACEEFAGPGRWQRRSSMGSFPLRFPHARVPDGLGWHIEGSYQPAGAPDYWANVFSRGRALLALYLFTDVDDADGPTRIRVGSHHRVPPVLAPFGEAGVSVFAAATALDEASADCPVALATGRAGDVYLCHPFLVHAAQANTGTRPRFIGQPSIPANRPYRLDLPDASSSPVELTIKRALR